MSQEAETSLLQRIKIRFQKWRFGDYQTIDLSTALNNYQNHRHACHVLFWCSTQQNPTFFALMQVRSDGLIGFPGGVCDNSPVDRNEMVGALNRELDEELNYKGPAVTMDQYLFSHLETGNNKVLHFFAMQLTEQQFLDIERTYQTAHDFLIENLGVFRIPLGSPDHGPHPASERFIGTFLQQKFSGNAKRQFKEAVLRLQLVNENVRKVILDDKC